jgi:hypothetical protein
MIARDDDNIHAGDLMLKYLLDSVRAALRGGTRSFSPAEEQVLSHVLMALPEGERSTLRSQIGAISLVQRQHPGRLVVAFYPQGIDVATLPYPGYEHCLAKVTYRSHGKKRITAVVLHNGRLMSLELHVPIVEADIEPPVVVTLHPRQGSTVATEIDAEEHRGAGRRGRS